MASDGSVGEATDVQKPLRFSGASTLHFHNACIELQPPRCPCSFFLTQLVCPKGVCISPGCFYTSIYFYASLHHSVLLHCYDTSVIEFLVTLGLGRPFFVIVPWFLPIVPKSYCASPVQIWQTTKYLHSVISCRSYWC